MSEQEDLYPIVATDLFPIIYPDGDGFFELANGIGNPGCDSCGTYDAYVQAGGTYFCVHCFVGQNDAALESATSVYAPFTKKEYEALFESFRKPGKRPVKLPEDLID